MASQTSSSFRLFSFWWFLDKNSLFEIGWMCFLGCSRHFVDGCTFWDVLLLVGLSIYFDGCTLMIRFLGLMDSLCYICCFAIILLSFGWILWWFTALSWNDIHSYVFCYFNTLTIVHFCDKKENICNLEKR